MVSDGFVTNLVVSLTGQKIEVSEIERLFEIEGLSDENFSFSYSDLEKFNTQEKSFYALQLVNTEEFEKADLKLSLNTSVAPIALSFQVDNHLGNARVDLSKGAKLGEADLKSLTVFSFGFILNGQSDKNAGLNSTRIELIFNDGKTEILDVEFSQNIEEITGGGGAAIVNMDDIEHAPLLETTMGSVHVDGKLSISGQFRRVIKPSDIKAVKIDGEIFPVM